MTMFSFIWRPCRRLLFGREIIIVSGLPRSGTSMMMRMLGAGGVPLLVDDVRAPDESNPLGFYEYERVKSLVSDPDRSWLRAARGRGVKIVSPLLELLPQTFNYKVILMERDVREIAASQDAMLARSGERIDTVPERRLLAMLEHEQRKARQLLRHRGCFVTLDVQYRDVLQDPCAQAECVARFLRGGVRAAAMAAAVDPRLYHHRA